MLHIFIIHNKLKMTIVDTRLQISVSLDFIRNMRVPRTFIYQY
mgnify:CR=1 FL=1